MPFITCTRQEIAQNKKNEAHFELWAIVLEYFIAILLQYPVFPWGHPVLYLLYLNSLFFAFSCILIDNSGFLVMHPFFIETTSPLKGQIHITYLVSAIKMAKN